MKICRYRAGDGPRWGTVDDGCVHALDGDPFGDHRRGAVVGDLADIDLLAPCEPTKVLCVGRNYRSLLAEQGRPEPATPFLFLKASTSVVGPGAPVLYPDGVSDMAHEGELAVVIGREARQLAEHEVDKVLLGYTAANDITVRDWQDPSAQWWRAKSADSHCPIGPWIETDFADPHDVRVRTLVNDELRQDGSTDDMVFSIPQLLVHITAHMTLLPGDVVLTGTAAGIRPVSPGDSISVEVAGVGTLRNPVVAWATGAAR